MKNQAFLSCREKILIITYVLAIKEKIKQSYRVLFELSSVIQAIACNWIFDTEILNQQML